MTGGAPKGGRLVHTPWGLPEWWAAESYGAPDGWEESRWRWEFLRRRADYRADFEAALAAQPDPLALPDDMTPEDGAWLMGDGLRAWPFPHAGAQRYGLGEFFDPVISDWMGLAPEWGSGIEWGGEHRREWIVAPGGGFTDAPAEHRFAFSFDLRRPLAAQLADARAELEQAQFEFFAYGAGAPEGLDLDEAEAQAARMGAAPKMHRAKWLLYLRALDAREAGASWAEMAEQFFAEGLLDRRAAPEGGYCAPPPQAARDVWQQARRLALRF